MPTGAITRRHLTLVDPSKNASKFYSLYTSEFGHVMFHWGRIGTAGQFKSDKIEPGEVEDFARRQMYAKLSKGYQRQSEDVFQAPTEAFRSPSFLENALQTWRKTAGTKAAEQDTKAAIDAFTEQVNRLITATKGQDATELIEDYMALRESWTHVQARLEIAGTAMELLDMLMRGESVSTS